MFSLNQHKEKKSMKTMILCFFNTVNDLQRLLDTTRLLWLLANKNIINRYALVQTTVRTCSLDQKNIIEKRLASTSTT
jgi:hypothetical protein